MRELHRKHVFSCEHLLKIVDKHNNRIAERVVLFTDELEAAGVTLRADRVSVEKFKLLTECDVDHIEEGSPAARKLVERNAGQSEAERC